MKRSKNKMIGGVCAGIAEAQGLDTEVTRMIALVMFIFGVPFIFLAYLILWIVVPYDDHPY